ncbi:hypothetical protein EVB32_160 [Rhizobium phage RHph_TM39]|uniref:Uncharacterized protein n=2 Tax=Cuauhnahuacvirus TaxID=3044696 RepID=A0A7S5R7U1_9CAUD|nr:hypothetical protein PQC16_gp160 [Rhizobium phage RHph_TM30]YP_010671308.1 hypothetical protein PQC17_gp159 [Rhizobium phage RHph_Y65]QIG71629.1 hypothetical protein EVB94_158 [Rhizobium phage RHph_TM40]QIG71993.1 hypothetical protein EVB95_159 [Rhizobium phage RHph_TM2_3B]QIG72356.1 hypothetical protein EVB96_160 [Rhizobium phage RHph_TM3_3_6]QIG77148.1 hypothetical protein EVB32_160 [Rhizobium phage RHph_TM39]QIG77481.1 hypothetical protein EVB61_153 [Rhizobium phage RHph_TM21B]QIG77744
MSSIHLVVVTIQPTYVESRIRMWQRRLGADRDLKPGATFSLYKIVESENDYIKVMGTLDVYVQRHLHLKPYRENIPPFRLSLVQ